MCVLVWGKGVRRDALEPAILVSEVVDGLDQQTERRAHVRVALQLGTRLRTRQITIGTSCERESGVTHNKPPASLRTQKQVRRLARPAPTKDVYSHRGGQNVKY